ncbi:MAG: imidazole glycerol phosphate synthase, glutamine amidotransferase subunit [Omnitrophica WOR_2 bacterium RBG_13_41_10]|nr:MAG: imidazole glycerol phosphate synthase, glutamine amidotransferase subunit [Omnitrophica WOR_2 bacterium RBG_13_41_10]
MTRIAIIDYGMGNIHSVQKALESLGAETIVTARPEDIKKSQKLVLPGVGAFDDAVAELKKQGLFDALIDEIKNKKIFLGICLGMQLLFKKSQEAVKANGLGILDGEVKRFDKKMNIKVPHMGWNQLKKVAGRRSQVAGECPLLKGIPDGAYVYFCHSYYPEPKNKDMICATTNYGGDFAAVVWQGNVYGTQFHPEKSQEIGLRILKNFICL